MLRPTPTSISISQDDISSVEKQMDMYLGLLKQGFKRADITRYFKEHQESPRAAIPHDEDLQAPSTVDLALQRADLTVGHVSPPPWDDAKEEGGHDASAEAEEIASPLLVASSPAEQPESTQTHAPRRSSMLRFSQNASPVRPDDRQQATREFVPPLRTYRPRTDTYSYSQSEFSESDPDRVADSSDDGDHTITINTQSSPMRPEADDFVPTSSRRVLESLRNVSLSVQSNTSVVTVFDSDDFSLTSIPRNPTPTPMPKMRDGDSEDSISLPPVPRPHRALSYNLRSRAKRQAAVVIPAPRTPARPSTSQLDGALAFSVYNDTLPAMMQPQTPADLVRHPLLSERDTAYTAPVGRLGSPVRHVRGRSHEYFEEGLPSPTAQAIANQTRRARELERRVRLEAGRLRRGQGTARPSSDSTDGTEQQEYPILGRAIGLSDSEEDEPDAVRLERTRDWRDDLEADRVGAENWELEEALRSEGRNPRVVSGNARRFLPL